MGSIQFGIERDLTKQLTKERRAILTEAALNETFDSSVIFSNSGSEKHSKDSHKDNHQDRSVSAFKSMFVRPGEESNSEEEATDDVEEIPRTEIAELSEDDIVWDEDFVLFIKMTPYPMTLEEFVVSITLIQSRRQRKLTTVVARPADLQQGRENQTLLPPTPLRPPSPCHPRRSRVSTQKEDHPP
jgi:hypothetical protein